MPRVLRLLVAVSALLVLAACQPGVAAVQPNDQVAADVRTEPAAEGAEGEGGGEAAPEGPVVAFAGAAAIAWDSAPSEAPAGPVTIELTCESLPHNVVIAGVNGDQPIVECPGEGVFTGGAELEPGDYEYFCDLPGHQGPMTGSLTVS